MARKTSPFAELTNEQKQLKWLEYQSIRLPYTEAEQLPCEAKEHVYKTQVMPESPPAPCGMFQANATGKNERPTPPPEVFVQSKKVVPAQAAEMQKTRHHQYDAVIARMKQAEMRTGSYQAWSK